MIPLFKVFMSEDVLKPVQDVLMSGFIGQGPKVETFERMLKERLQNHLVVTTNSGTSADHLAVRLLKKAFKDWPGI